MSVFPFAIVKLTNCQNVNGFQIGEIIGIISIYSRVARIIELEQWAHIYGSRPFLRHLVCSINVTRVSSLEFNFSHYQLDTISNKKAPRRDYIKTISKFHQQKLQLLIYLQSTVMLVSLNKFQLLEWKYTSLLFQ